LTRRSFLFTEMVTSAAVVHGNREHLLGFDAVEQPVALQLGGSDPAELATAYVMLADPLSSYTSGTTVAITGGKPFI